MAAYAILETGGKQYRVAKGAKLRVEKLAAEKGEEVIFNRVLMVNQDGNLEIGTPYVKGAKVVGRVLTHGKGKKIIVFKYKPKKNYRRKQGHRQPYTELLIEDIKLG